MITLKTKDVERALALVSRVVPSVSTLSSLSMVRLQEVRGATILMTGTNTLAEITANVGTNTTPDGDFDFCLPGDKLAAALKVGGETITIKIDGAKARVSTGRSKFTLNTVPGGELPSIETGDKGVQFVSETLPDDILRVSFAAAAKDVRYYMCGVHIASNGHEIATVATNGATLAAVQRKSDAPVFKATVPTKLAELLAKVGEATYEIREQCIIAKTTDATLIFKTIEGQYPDWTRVIPAAPRLQNSITLMISDVKAAIQLAGAYTDRSKGIKLVADGDVCTISGAGGDGNDFKFEAPINGTKGEPVDVGFNAVLLGGILQHIEGEELTLSWASQQNAFLASVGEWSAVIMPLRN